MRALIDSFIRRPLILFLPLHAVRPMPSRGYPPHSTISSYRLSSSRPEATTWRQILSVRSLVVPPVQEPKARAANTCATTQ